MKHVSEMTDDELNELMEAKAPEAPAESTAKEAAAHPQGDHPANAQPSAGPVSEPPAPQAPPAHQQPQVVPLAALHEERGRRQQLQSALDDPQFIAQQAARHGLQVGPAQQHQPTDFFEDPEKAFNERFQAHAAPLIQELHGLRQERAQRAEADRHTAAASHFGADSVADVSKLEQAAPGLAGLDTFTKAAIVHGMKWADPEYRKQQIAAEAKKQAEDTVAAALVGGKKQTPVTLSGITPSEKPEDDLDASQYSGKELAGMSDAQLDKMLRRGAS